MITGTTLIILGTVLMHVWNIPLWLTLCFVVPGIFWMKEEIDQLKDTMRMQEQKIRCRREAERRRLEKAYMEEPEYMIAYKEGAVMAYNETLKILREEKECD